MPGGPVIKNPHFQSREHEFDPWSGDRSPMPHSVVKKKKKRLARVWLMKHIREAPVALIKVN